MPAITSGKVLVSGANGYLGVSLVETLLGKGYSVRAVVRSANKGEYLTKLFGGPKFELAIVEDITAVRKSLIFFVQLCFKLETAWRIR